MSNHERLHPARWWDALENHKVKCSLCPRECVIAAGAFGFCSARKNIDGELKSIAYGRPVSLQVDPIEKKPLARFLSGTSTFSLGTFGCNLNCCFCQNSSISRGHYEEAEKQRFFPPDTVVQMALEYKCHSIAFTYNEPTIFAEYAIDIAEKAHRQGLATVLVSNGYITPGAAADLYPHIDAANIDMKGFSEDFYREMCGASLQPVLDAIKYFYNLGRHLEITNLVIPGKNDSVEMIDLWLDWVENNLDKDIPLHFSAFHPAHKYNASTRTPRETLFRIKTQANSRGFNSVFLGNI